MLYIRFKYADAVNNWKWQNQICVVSSIEECIKWYGLDKDDVKYKIVSVKKV